MFDPYFTPEMVLFHTAIFLAGVLIATWKGFGPVEAWVDRWASAHSVALTAENRSAVTQRLRRGRRIRTAGFLIGWSLPYIAFWLVRDGRSDSGRWTRSAFILGYLVAAVVAELTDRRDDGRTRVASLDPRRLDAYMPRWAHFGPWVIAFASLMTVAVYAVVPWREWPDGSGPSVATQLGRALLIVGTVVAIEVVQRFIVQRRQTYSTADMVQADDALRSSSVSILAGVSMGLSLNIWSGLIWSLGGRTDVQVLRWVAPFTALGMVVTALIVFMRLSNPLLQWRVRRPVSVRQPA